MIEHHIGVVVSNVEESGNIFESLGFEICSNVIVDMYQHNRILFLQNPKTLQKIELIEAMDEQSTVKSFKFGLHHICYEVDINQNFREVFRKLKIGKIFTPNIIAPALDNRNVMFAYLKNGILVEFLMVNRINDTKDI